MRLPRPSLCAIGLGVVAQGLFCWRLTTPSKLMFDEVHYVPAARAMLELARPVNIEHPLLGKAIIAAGIAICGDGPLGWRFPSTLAGTATVLGVFACLHLLFGRTRTALVGGLLVLLNFTVFVQARIAMLDGFMAAFVILALAAMLWAMRSRRYVAGKFLLGCVLLGLAAGTKWAAIPYIACAGFALMIMRWRDADDRHWPGLKTIPALAMLCVASAAAYLATFAPAFFYASDPLTLPTLIPFQATMYARQTEILAAHTYQSSWWTWAAMIRPIWYLYEPVDGAVRGVLMIGNPAIMWGGLIAVALCLWGGWRDAEPKLLAVAGLWIASYGIWGIIPKSLGFYYYYYLSSIFLCIAIAAAFDHYRRRWLEDWDGPFLMAASALFVWFHPILSAAPLPGPQAFTRWMWLDSWR